MYKLRANQRDLDSHVANASFMVNPRAQGTGVGQALGRHCLAEARSAGSTAMQFNFVVSTNTGRRLALEEIGILDRWHGPEGVQVSGARIRRRLCDSPLPERQLATKEPTHVWNRIPHRGSARQVSGAGRVSAVGW